MLHKCRKRLALFMKRVTAFSTQGYIEVKENHDKCVT